MDNSITHDKELVAVDVAAMENLVWPHKTTLTNIEVQGSKAFIQLATTLEHSIVGYSF